MDGPQGFIHRQGEIYEIKRGENVSQAKGLVHPKGRKHISFLPEADIQLEDVLFGTVSRNKFRVIEVERQNYEEFGVVINAYYENLDRIAPPERTTSVNTVNIGTMANSTLQQASPGAVQNLFLNSSFQVFLY